MKKLKVILLDIIRMQDIFEDGLALASLAATLRTEGHEVEIQKYRENAIDYDRISSVDAHIIGFTCGSYNLLRVLEACKIIRHRCKNALICLGGYSPTFYYNDILEKSADVDVLVRGEGEDTIKELAACIADGIAIDTVKGIAFRDSSGKIIVTGSRPQIADLDSLPFPSRDILKQHKFNIAPLESARGCLGRCSFCSFKQFWVDTATESAVCFREKSPERVIEEIKHVVTETGVKRITFVDGSFELSIKHKQEKLRKIAQGIIDNSLNISYYFSARINFYKFLGNEILELMVKSGFCGVFLGVESFYQDDLDLFQKGILAKDNIEALEQLKKYPINVDIGLINFHPFSTFEGLRQNAHYVHYFGYAARFFLIEPLILFRGTKIYDDCKRERMILEEDILAVKKYKYADIRVEVLVNVITRYFCDVINNESILTIEISDYFNDHLDVMCGIKWYFESQNKAVELNMVNDYLDQLYTIKNELNDLNQKWFLELLDIAEKGHTDEKAYFDILEQHVSKGILKEIAQKLRTQKFRIFMSLQRMDRSYKDLF